jgi:uncharacterized protein YbjT (DUF2867 family)
MRIVIVGATGNIGTVTVERLATDHELRLVAGRRPSLESESHRPHAFHSAE